MFLRGDLVIYDRNLRRFVTPLLDLDRRVDESFLDLVFDARDLVIPMGNFRTGRVSSTTRILLYTS